LTVTTDEATFWMDVLFKIFARTAERLGTAPAGGKVGVR